VIVACMKYTIYCKRLTKYYRTIIIKTRRKPNNISTVTLTETEIETGHVRSYNGLTKKHLLRK